MITRIRLTRTEAAGSKLSGALGQAAEWVETHPDNIAEVSSPSGAVWVQRNDEGELTVEPASMISPPWIGRARRILANL